MTFVEEAVDAVKAGVVVVPCVGVELDDETALRRVELGLSQ